MCSARRGATRDEGTIAGFNPVRILNKPMAAAIPSGLDNKDKAWSRFTSE
jgi:molecular chaperone DnaK (HSP70)